MATGEFLIADFREAIADWFEFERQPKKPSGQLPVPIERPKDKRPAAESAIANQRLSSWHLTRDTYSNTPLVTCH
jgi:hypothetical protein